MPMFRCCECVVHLSPCYLLRDEDQVPSPKNVCPWDDYLKAYWEEMR